MEVGLGIRYKLYANNLDEKESENTSGAVAYNGNSDV